MTADASDGSTASPCSCGQGSADADGFCGECGRRVPVDDAVRLEAGPLAGAVSHRGLVHATNEDAVGLQLRSAQDGRWVVDVALADGVSTAGDPAGASSAAVRTAMAALEASGMGTAVEVALDSAMAAAGAAVAELGAGCAEADIPACTVVVARVTDGQATVSWVGDSRAALVGASGPAVALTIDDSWAVDAIAGGMPAEQAWTDRRAHMITGWLGADAAPVPQRASSTRWTGGGPAWLVVCSDGLWNYLPDPAGLADAVRQAVTDGATAVGAAELLRDLALQCGGRDNVTVALVGLDPMGV